VSAQVPKMRRMMTMKKIDIALIEAAEVAYA
jgi:hypothetical protein